MSSNFLTSSLARLSSYNRSHLNYRPALCWHTLFLVIFFLDASLLLWQVGVWHCAVQCDIVHHVHTFAERTITQHGQSPEVIQVLYVHKSTFHCAQPRTLCWCVGFSSKLRPAKEASCRAKISNWWLVVVQLLVGFHGTMQNALHASEVCPAACRSCLPNLFLCLHG